MLLCILLYSEPVGNLIFLNDPMSIDSEFHALEEDNEFHASEENMIFPKNNPIFEDDD